ncbi:MAG: UDP-N-acetylmuramoyl-L-alanine--D-glutamate ligase [Ruminococcaceae bacterium]|nr:UDP-N-acetylmuramoyl-L-alanine--D-glutamate ligase [Oscillospiraceae bacterium]
MRHLNEYLDSLKGNRIAVLGLGVSNQPLVRLLLSHGLDVTACDKTSSVEKLALGDLGAKLHLGEDYLQNLDADVIFRTPGMRPDLEPLQKAVENGAVLTSEMEAFFEVCPCRIIAVTGSDGKTTTTTLISELLKAAGKKVWVGGNIGTPLLDRAAEMAEDDIAVLELSSFQLMTMACSPSVAVVTNLAPNHLDMHKDMAEYVDAKKNIFLHQNENGKLVLNADNDITCGFAPEAKGSVQFFSRREKQPCGLWADETTIYRGEQPLLQRDEILIPGVHNVENYMAAICAVEGLVPDDVIRQVAMHFGGVEHRIELVREKDGVRYYNDSIASSPSRTIAGLRSFDRKVILIAGGYDKNIPYDVLGPEIVEHCKRLVLTGATAPKIRTAVETAPEYKGTPVMEEYDDFYAAIRAAADAAEAGDVVILSPASASFDRFRNFMERGEAFKQAVWQM